MVGPLPDSQSEIIRRIARRFSRDGINRRTIDLDDYYQSAYLEAWKIQSREGPIADALVRRAAILAMRSLDRLEFRRGMGEEAAASNPRAKLFSVDPDPAMRLDASAALAKLPASQRAALVASCWLGMSPQEGGEAINRSRVAFNGVAKRARETGRKFLEDAYGEWGGAFRRRYCRRRIFSADRLPRRLETEEKREAERRRSRAKRAGYKRKTLWEQVSRLRCSRKSIPLRSGSPLPG